MKETLSQEVYEKIINSIITGEYNQDMVLTEGNLIKTLGFSRSPIREALVLLCNDDILYSIPRYGYKLKVSNRKYLDEIIQLRRIVEPAYLDKYFDRITDVDIKNIESKLVTMDRTEFSNPSEYWEKTSLFHLALAYSYKDQFFYDMIKKILSKQWITFSMLYWSNWSDVVDSKLSDNHNEILNAIQLNNRQKAIEALIKDVNSF